MAEENQVTKEPYKERTTRRSATSNYKEPKESRSW